MSTTAIEVNGLSKQYRLGLSTRADRTLSDLFAHGARGLLKRLRGQHAARSQTFYALNDVSFDVAPGECVGLIGRNGAGKSTLLKILSGITDPTAGSARIRGRVSSLLEVGTGFHPELTGRENIFLNGAILGMNRAEIRKKFDAIVDFSGVERFLDTPVKRYSSGMSVRLAFAVAAHLEPEILIVDEVLAVGDYAFQKKCLGKLSDVASQGRTILFVSHNMQAVRKFCTRAIWLQDGQIAENGDTAQVITHYEQDVPTAEHLEDVAGVLATLSQDDVMRIHDVKVEQDSQATNHVINGRPIDIEIQYELLREAANARVFFDAMDEQGCWLFRSFHDQHLPTPSHFHPGRYVSRATIPADLLTEQTYTLRIGCAIYGDRRCMPEYLHLPLFVRRGGQKHQAYAIDPKIREGALTLPLTWNNQACTSTTTLAA